MKALEKPFASQIWKQFTGCLGSMPVAERLVMLLWLAGPFVFLVERSPADIWLVLMDCCFIVRCIHRRDWHWLGQGWVRGVLGFFFAVAIANLFSPLVFMAQGELLLWMRFPLFAAASVFWLGRNPVMLRAMLVMIGLAMLLLAGGLSAEIIANPGKLRLEGFYGDLVPGGYFAKSALPLVALLALLAMEKPLPLGFVAGTAAFAAFVFCLLTGERMNSGMIGLAILLAALTARFAWPRLLFFGVLGLAGLMLMLTQLPATTTIFLEATSSTLGNYFDGIYWASVRPGVISFLENPLTGIGSGMHRHLCPSIAQLPSVLPGSNDCHPHPHQFYVQLAGEAGLIGLIGGIVMIGLLIRHCLAGRRSVSPLARAVWVVPVVMFMPKSNADFFGQWNNLFLWFGLGLAMAMATEQAADSRS